MAFAAAKEALLTVANKNIPSAEYGQKVQEESNGRPVRHFLQRTQKMTLSQKSVKESTELPRTMTRLPNTTSFDRGTSRCENVSSMSSKSVRG